MIDDYLFKKLPVKLLFFLVCLSKLINLLVFNKVYIDVSISINIIFVLSFSMPGKQIFSKKS